MSVTKVKLTKQVYADADFDFNAKRITNLATPTSGSDAVTKDYADNLLGAADALRYKGVLDCSTNPNYPAGNAGDFYKVSVSGKIGGASGLSVTAGDDLICLVDSAAAGTHAAVGANWNQIVNSAGGGDTVGPASATDNAVARFDNTTGKLIQNSNVTIDDNGSVNIPSGQAYKINGAALNQDNVADGTTNKAFTATEKTKLAGVDANALNKTSIMANYICREVPTGTKNGSNTDFTLANTPVAGMEMVFVNGILMNAGAGNDYTISGAVITFLTGAIPVSTDVILVTYWK